MIKYQILSEEDLNRWLASNSGWLIIDSTLQARFIMPDFRSAVALINMVAIEAEVINHHPTYTHSFRTIDLSLSTHDACGQITLLYCKLASYISKVANNILLGPSFAKAPAGGQAGSTSRILLL